VTSTKKIVKVNGKAKMDLDGLVERATAKKNGTVMDIGSSKVKKDDRQATRLAFIKQNAATILKAWDALKWKKSGAALNRVLPGMHNKWVDEVLMLAGLRQSGEEVVIKAVNEDKPLLKDIVAPRKVEARANK